VIRTYLFDISTFQSDGTTMLESYSDYLTIAPKTLRVASISILGNQKSGAIPTYSIFLLSFTTGEKVPKASPQTSATDEQGQLELRFPSGEWDSDLGTGYDDGGFFSCKSILGLSPSTLLFIHVQNSKIYSFIWVASLLHNLSENKQCSF